MFFEILLGIFFIYFITLLIYRRASDVPPGPTPIPILGNILKLALLNGKNVHLALDTLAKKYGDVMSIQFGSKDFVVLSSYEALRDSLGRDDFSGRPFDSNLASRSYNKRLGIIFLDGEDWKEQRRFTLKHLRGLGFGKQKAMDIVIAEELQEVLSRIRNKMGDGSQAVLHMHNFFNLSVLNILWTLIAGVRYSHEDEKLNDLLHRVDEIMKSGSIGGLKSAFPILKKLFPKLSGESRQMGIYRSLQDFISETINEHKKSSSYGESGDFMDIYLQEVEKGEGRLFNDEQLTMVCLDMFFAGSETTSVTLGFAILYMMLFPQIQEKVYNEIIQIVGTSRAPNLQDKDSLHYTQAVLLEIQRIANVVPITPPHFVKNETTFKGFRIPSDSIIFINLYAIHMSKEVWGDPEVFRPERFIDNQGKLLRDERLIPFGIGKRICLGESLAKMSLFLYFSTLMQQFKFETVPGVLKPSTEPVVGFTFSPLPYDAVITNRLEIYNSSKS